MIYAKILMERRLVKSNVINPERKAIMCVNNNIISLKM